MKNVLETPIYEREDHFSESLIVSMERLVKSLYAAETFARSVNRDLTITKREARSIEGRSEKEHADHHSLSMYFVHKTRTLVSCVH